MRHLRLSTSLPTGPGPARGRPPPTATPPSAGGSRPATPTPLTTAPALDEGFPVERAESAVPMPPPAAAPPARKSPPQPSLGLLSSPLQLPAAITAHHRQKHARHVVHPPLCKLRMASSELRIANGELRIPNSPFLVRNSPNSPPAAARPHPAPHTKQNGHPPTYAGMAANRTRRRLVV
jgi:hypothetical protein